MPIGAGSDAFSDAFNGVEAIEQAAPGSISKGLGNAEAAGSAFNPGAAANMTIQRIEAGARMSKVVIHGDTVYLAGLTANKTVGQSLAEQSKEILGLIDGFLAQAGTDKSKLLQATIWLSDIRTVDEFNKVWDAWAVAGQTPARACIEALLQGPDKKIEIQVTAAR